MIKSSVMGFVCTALLVLGFNGLGWAEEEEAQNYVRPLREVFMTEVVYPQGKGEVQLTAMPQFQEGTDAETVIIPLDIKYGLTDAWQAELEWEAVVNRNPDEGESVHRSGDLAVGTKYSFMNISGLDFHAAVGFNISFPIGDIDEELTEGFIGYEPYLVLAKDLPQFLKSHVFTSLGINFVQRVKKHEDSSEDEPEAHELNWGVGYIVPVGPVCITVEFDWSTNEWNNDGEKNRIYLTPGLVWNLPRGWSAGIGVPIGLNDDADDFWVMGMVVYKY